jgi:hypothetical protein
MKKFLLAITLLFSAQSISHPASVNYEIQVGFHQYGIYLISNSDHFHYCDINGYYFELYPRSMSRVYPYLADGSYYAYCE